MENTIGVIIFDITGKILITKPTNGFIWSFPKGLPNVGEDFKTSALREVLEETGLDLNKIDGILSNNYHSQQYKKRYKIVNLFEFHSNEQIDGIYEIKCNSCFELNGKFIQENDEEKWLYPIEALEYLHEAQKIILEKIIKNN